MNKQKTVFTLLAILWIHGLSAQVLTLDSVLSTIERNNPMLKMFEEEINADNAYSQGAKSWMPPTLSSGPWMTPYSDFKQGTWMISAEQMIPNPSKQDANQKFMQGMAAVEQQGKSVQRNQLFAAARSAYYEWIVLKKKYTVSVQIDSLLSYLFQTAQVRYAYNKEKLNNIFRAQADLYELRNMETMFLAEMDMKNTALCTLMKVNRLNRFDIDTVVHERNYELALNDSVSVAAKRSDVRQYDASVDLLKLKQSIEYSKRLPDFGVSVAHMQSLGMMPSQYSVMGMVTIPIVGWASKEYKANVKGLKSQMNAVEFQKQSLINETLGDISMLQIEIKSAKLQLSNYRNNIVPAYYKSYQTALLAYGQNTGDLFVVLDAFKMYRMASMSELDQLNNLLKLQAAYEKEMEIR
jgi:hypothetical protein